MAKRFEREGRQLILHSDGEICTQVKDLIQSEVFQKVVVEFCDGLVERQSLLIEPFVEQGLADNDWEGAIDLLRALASVPLEQAVKLHPEAEGFLEAGRRAVLNDFAEELYNYWRSFNRFMVLHSEPGPSSMDRRPYRSFNYYAQGLADLVRACYRDICENIIGSHPRIYRQVDAGCNIALIAVPRRPALPERFQARLGQIPFIRQVWMAPPLIIDPPMNKRTGEFKKVERDLLDGWQPDPGRWLCYPAQVGPLVILIYFQQCFISLGSSLCNLFELATDEQLAAGVDAVYFYGVPPDALSDCGELPTVFSEDSESGVLVGAVPAEDRFGYFGYLKKMVLTLHNIVMLKRGRMPFHGAMVRISVRGGRTANVLIIGDTATGKSESLEALRLLGGERVRDLHIVADDMGSLELDADGSIRAYGTEIGAFIRLDDLQQGYAFQQIDRAVIMSPQKVNARVVLPVTTTAEVLSGCPVHFMLYANNYESLDAERPALERFDSPEAALAVFRAGAAMAKGTTTSVGLGHTYFANIFGPPQYRELHDCLAEKVFAAAFAKGVFVGQLRTRLGIPGFESSGPQQAAQALLDAISRPD